ncbi:glycosyltransferase family 9 protein [Psychrosphaera algicola]|uniref:Glycosyltransferase family 9 protein n=1 Tax=Psychrosphaera algicola TaxID=3023714 RepID=A0ABT5FCR7_9GAMM|nr:glycosyltransferase family 9 protein [Psychrosphaera sp. G1-22]MDC2888834.1 glycosyltransferase family 9 protein [Psychrosphaera sp. G1-22]
MAIHSTIPKRILIIRTSAIGDVIMASPMVAALADRYPNAELFWLLEPHLEALVSSNPNIHGVVAFPKAEWKRLFKERRYRELFYAIKSMRDKLRDLKIDLAIDVQGLAKSGIWAWLSNAKRRVGFISKEPTKIFMTERINKPKNDPEISSEYKAMAQYLGCNTESFYMDIHISSSDKTHVATKLLEWLPFSGGIDQFAKVSSQIKINEDKINQDTHRYNSRVKQAAKAENLGTNLPYLVICPFTTRPQKHWVNSHWRDLIKQISIHFGLPVLVIGGPDDHSNATKIVAELANAKSLCGELSLIQNIEVISKAKALIGVDTGMTHAGIAKSVPTVALFGSTRPYLVTRVEQTEVLYLNKSCAPCKRNPSCNGTFDCMADISVPSVMTTLNRILNSSSNTNNVRSAS